MFYWVTSSTLIRERERERERERDGSIITMNCCDLERLEIQPRSVSI